MGLLSIFKRQSEAPRGAIAASDAAESVQHARVRARQRLIGAAVLVIIGVIGFPLLFESTPRPIPVNIPIEIPPQGSAPPLVMPPARAPQGAASSAAVTAVQPAAPAPAPEPVTATTPAAATASPAPSPPAPPVQAAPVKPPVVAPAVPAKPTASRDDGARAKALLNAKPAPAPSSERFVVQVGAFADNDAAQAVRKKVEATGLKTYTQVTDTSAGKRVRVRIGPFNSRDEAERALAKAKAGGFSAVVMPL